MDDPKSSLALREIRDHLARRSVLAALAGVTAVLALVGPFGTETRLGLGARLAYWAEMVWLTYAAGYAVRQVCEPALRRRAAPFILALAITGPLTGLVVLVVVIGLNALVLGWVPDWPGEFLGFALTIIAIASVIAVAIMWAGSEKNRPDPDKQPALLRRVALDKRGAQVALSAQDHYVRVETTKGQDLVLIRLGDAIAEASPVKGMQVHRSHWVALGQIATAQRDGERAVLTMTTSTKIPVSRNNLPALRDAGIL